MPKPPRGPGLNKIFRFKQRDYSIHSVSAFGVRDLTRADEEFTNVAIHSDFPRLVPKHEIWIDERLFEAEAVFYLANALVRLNEAEKGAEDLAAYTAGLNTERQLRERLIGVKYRGGRAHKRVPRRIYESLYLTIPDKDAPIEVFEIDGNLARCFYKTDYTEGGHGYVYAWVPKREIWVEKEIDPGELPFIIAHEYTELRLMRELSMEYDPAHEVAAKVEYLLREADPFRDRWTDGRDFSKSDLATLATDRYFEAVRKRYRLG